MQVRIQIKNISFCGYISLVYFLWLFLMFKAAQFIGRILRRNVNVEKYLNDFNINYQEFVSSHYSKLVNKYKDEYEPEEIAFACFIEFCYVSPSMTCDVLYQEPITIRMPGCGILDNEYEFDYMISYIFKRGYCDSIFKKYSILLDRVFGVIDNTERLCDMFDVGERHFELQLFESLLTVTQHFYQIKPKKLL